MKKILGSLAMAILGGTIALGGYKMMLEEKTDVITSIPKSLETVQTNYKPAYTANNSLVSAEAIDFTVAAEKTVNSVVHVKNTATRTQTNPFAELLFGGGGTRKFEQVGTGSGVIISPDGYIVTNNHVIENSNELEITLNNKKKYKAELIGADKSNDIALLKINADEQLPYTPFANSDNIKIGEWVLAVGNPYNLTSTVTAGIVSAKGRDLEGNTSIDSFIQTDAAVNPGNSGGALVNTRGELVGINTAISSRTGSFIGYSFAVPSNIAKKIVDDLLEYGAIQEAVIGIRFDPRADDKISGVKIVGVEEGQGAEKAGLKADDIIVKVNSVNITKFSELRGQLTAKRPGETVNITVDRDGDLLTKSVTLSKKVKQIIARTFNWELKDLSKKQMKNRDVKKGVLIYRTADERNDLSGYIITKINDKEVSNAEDAAKLIDGLSQSNYRNNIIEMINDKGVKERFRF